MIPTLGGLSLWEYMVITGLDADRIAADTQRSDEGVLQVLVAPVEGGRELTLKGYVSFAQEELILAMSAQGVAVELVHQRFTGSVLVLGVTLEDWIEYSDPLPSDWRVGTIRVLEV